MFSKRELNLMLIKVGAKHKRRSAYEFMKRNLSSGQPRMLNFLFEHDGCIQREIASACHLEPASVTSVLNSMERAGLIERKPVEEDKRAFRVWLTKKGKENKKIVDEIFESMANECFKGFSEEERQLCGNFLNRIFENMTDQEKDKVDGNDKTI